MFVNLRAENLIVTFDYDPLVIKAVRSINGRLFDKRHKRWTVPKTQVIDAYQKLKPLGFTFNIDVINVYRAEQKKIEKLEAIKTADFKKLVYEDDLPLKDFQKQGVMFLNSSPAALLGDVPGLGKTIQTIAALKSLPRILVFCPASLKYSWADEIKKWLGEEALVIDGPKATRKMKWDESVLKDYHFIIANYELLLHDYAQIKRVDWPAIVCDEAHRVANPLAKTTKALKTLPATHKIALSGTPVSNSPVDIYSIIDWLSPGYFGSFHHFRNKYCVLEERWHSIIGYKNLEELKRLSERFVLRRTKEEVFDDFPAKTYQDIIFDLSDEEKKLYTDIKDQILEELSNLEINKISLGVLPVKMLRLKQAVDHPHLLGSNVKSSKFEALKDVIAPIVASEDKLIIFTQFAEMAKLLSDLLKVYDPFLIHGDVPAEKRQQIVKEFNEGDRRVLIMTEAGAYGLNLQSASSIIHFDFPWSVAKLTQREGRAHRIGQTKPVTVYNMIAKNSIDEYVVKALHKKQKMSVDLLGDQDRLEKQGLSDEDIKAILRL